MDFYQYQYADPVEISELKDKEFNKLLKDRIYDINPSFVQSQQCMERLIDNIINLQIGKQTLKLVKDLVKFFQSPILYCLREFYSKHKKYFRSLSKSQDQGASPSSASKELKLLQQIGSIYLKLTNGQEEIEQLSFFTEYGVSDKDVSLTKKDQEYQNKYLRWLKKSLVTLQVLKQQMLGQRARLNWVSTTQNQFQGLVKNRQSKWLQKFTIDDIIGESEDIPNFHKNISKKQSKDIQESSSNISPPSLKDNLNNSQNIPQNDDPSKVIISSKKNVKDQKQNLSKISPYFRKFFYQDQNLFYAQDVNLEYKNFKVPYDRYCVKQLRRAICAFLNRGGGVILVGIKEDLDDKSRTVKGQRLSEYKKEEVLKDFKQICQQIQPDIISQAKYHIKFVPIKNKNGNYIQGKYIVRIEVSKGDSKCLYTVNQDGTDYVMIRTANQVLRRPINQRTLYNFKQKLLNPPSNPALAPCPEPQIGIPLLEDKHQTRFNQKHEYCPDQDQYQELYMNPYYESRQKWKLKTDPVSPATKEIKPKDFVYFNPVNNQAKQQVKESKNGNKNRNFICDEQENEEDVGEKQLKVNKQDSINKQKSQKNNILKNVQNKDQNGTKNDKQNEQNEQDGDLDFKPINPLLPKRQFQQSKQFYQPFKKKQNTYIPKPDPKKFQNYEVNRASLATYVDKPSTIDLLVIGLPFATVNQIVLQTDLPLVQPPILCNQDFVTWLSINSKQKQTNAKIDKLMIQINKRWKAIPQGNQKKKIKVRKLFSNVQFRDQILLNKFVYKFSHDQQFCDQRGVYYYACKDKQQAIQAYMIGYNLDIVIKFISSEDLKARKLQYLKSRVEKRENQKNQRNNGVNS